MKATVIARHKSSGNLHEVKVYSSFVFFVNDCRTESRTDFDEFFEIIDGK